MSYLKIDNASQGALSFRSADMLLIDRTGMRAGGPSKRRLVLGSGFRPVNTRTTYSVPQEKPARLRVGRKVRIGK